MKIVKLKTASTMNVHKEDCTPKEYTEIQMEDAGTEWMEHLSDVFGNPYDAQMGSEVAPQQFVRFRLDPQGKGRPFHLSVSRSRREDNPFFRVNLSVSPTDNPRKVYCSSVLRFIPQPDLGSVKFVGNGFRDPDFELTVFNTGRYQVLSEP
jgi:hypothetical protein